MAETLWFAILLILCCGLCWLLSSATRAHPQLMLRLAAGIYLLFAITAPFSHPLSALWPLAPTLILPVLALTALTLAVHSGFRRPLSWKIQLGIFVIAIGFALAAVFFDRTELILPPQLIAIVTSLVIARKGSMRLSAPSLMLAAGAGSMLAALAALISAREDGIAAALLFSAAGLLGQTLAVTRICDTFVPGPQRTDYKIP